MLNLYLFEIECAEKIGAFKIADSIQNRMIKEASKNYRKIVEQVKLNPNVKDATYYKNLDKLIVSLNQDVTNAEKNKIKEKAKDLKIQFKYSSKKTIDELLLGKSIDPVDVQIEEIKKKYNTDDHIGLDIFDEDQEPTTEQLKFTEEFPEFLNEDDDNDESSLDHLLLLIALEDIKKNLKF